MKYSRSDDHEAILYIYSHTHTHKHTDTALMRGDSNPCLVNGIGFQIRHGPLSGPGLLGLSQCVCASSTHPCILQPPPLLKLPSPVRSPRPTELFLTPVSLDGGGGGWGRYLGAMEPLIEPLLSLYTACIELVYSLY